jgi:hypothetical protein
LLLGAEADIGLSERGLRGAKEITPTLALHFPAAIIRSPMRRALESPPPSVPARNLPLTRTFGDDFRPPGRPLAGPYPASVNPRDLQIQPVIPGAPLEKPPVNAPAARCRAVRLTRSPKLAPQSMWAT